VKSRTDCKLFQLTLNTAYMHAAS